MVMRTIFDIIDVPPKFNADRKQSPFVHRAISIEYLFISSSLLNNQTFVFDTSDNPSADVMLQDWQDMCVAACMNSDRYFNTLCRPLCSLIGARWKNVDKWIASRFSKTSELTARLAAQIAHIDLADELLRAFLEQNTTVDPSVSVSFETYCAMVDFFHERNPPMASSVVTITGKHLMHRCCGVMIPLNCLSPASGIRDLFDENHPAQVLQSV